MFENFRRGMRALIAGPIMIASLALALVLGGMAPVAAAEPVPQHNTNAFWFENWGDLSNAELRIRMPNGEITNVQAGAGTPVFQLSGQGILDGVYTYELTAATSEKAEVVNQIDNGRGSDASGSAFKPFYKTGSFQVSRGVIVTPETLNEDGDQ